MTDLRQVYTQYTKDHFAALAAQAAKNASECGHAPRTDITREKAQSLYGGKLINKLITKYGKESLPELIEWASHPIIGLSVPYESTVARSFPPNLSKLLDDTVEEEEKQYHVSRRGMLITSAVVGVGGAVAGGITIRWLMDNVFWDTDRHAKIIPSGLRVAMKTGEGVVGALSGGISSASGVMKAFKEHGAEEDGKNNKKQDHKDKTQITSMCMQCIEAWLEQQIVQKIPVTQREDRTI